MAGDAHRRPARRDLAARRRQGQPDRPDPGAGQGGPAAGCPGRRAGAGHRLQRGRPGPGGRRVTGVRTDHGDVEARDRRQLRRPVGQGARRPGRRRRCRCTPPSTSTSSPTRSRVCTRTCRSCATPTATPTSRRRSAAWSSAASSPRPSRGSSPDEIPYPFEFQLLDEDWEHFSVLMDEALQRIPALERHRHPQVLQRARELHARQPVHPRRGARSCAASSSAPGFNSVGIASAGGAGRALAEWIVDGRADRPTCCSSTSAGSRRSTATHRWLRDRVVEVLGLHYEIPWPNRELRDGAAVPAARRCTTGSARAGRGFGSRMGWERPNFFAPAGPARRAIDVLAGASRTGCPGRRRAARLPGRRSRCSTRRRSRKYVVSGPDALGAAAVGLHGATSTCRSGTASTPPLLNRRGTYEADLTVTRIGAERVPARQQRGHHGARPGLDPAPPAAGLRGWSSTTSPRRSRCSA